MEEDASREGTVLSKMKPIVTMLTDALARDFVPSYKRMQHFPSGSDESLWLRTGEDGSRTVITDDQLRADVEKWLLGLEQQMENESDRKYAQMVTHMIRKNRGWVTLLTNRVKKRIR